MKEKFSRLNNDEIEILVNLFDFHSNPKTINMKAAERLYNELLAEKKSREHMDE